MKRKLFLVLLTVCVLALVTGALVGCGTKLANPQHMGLVDGNFVWGPVEGADGYLIYFNDNEADRFYTTDTKLSIDNPNIRSNLKSGTINGMWVRAVTLKGNLPDKMSDRSLWLFSYSKKLATPNSVKLKGQKFSWRSVSDATDYKALVRKDGETEATEYNMTWATGTASINGTIDDLPDGYTYHVSIIAVAEGYENSDPSVDITYDRSVTNVDKAIYYLSVGDNRYTFVEDANDNVYRLQVNCEAGATLAVSDSKGKTYAFAATSAVQSPVTEKSDYIITLDDATGTLTGEKVLAYYLYVGSATTGVRLNLSQGVYSTTMVLTESQTYVVKDGSDNIVRNYAEGSVSEGVAGAAGTFVLTVDAGGAIKVTVGQAQESGSGSGGSQLDGQWPVSFDYNYDGAPDPVVAYAKDNRAVNTPATPIRNGYEFAGWYEDSYCLIVAEFGSTRSLFTITAPTTLYAKWTPSTTAVECTDHVDANGDGQCDRCGKKMTVVCSTHIDLNNDGQCDRCGTKLGVSCDYHVDSDGDGVCDKCLRTMPVDEDTYGKIYLDVTSFTWFGDANAVINVYIWYTDGENTGFPGTVMTKIAEGMYEASYYTSRTIKGVIFTRNNPNRNPAEGEKTEWDRIELGEFAFNPATPVYKLRAYNKTEDSVTFTGKWLAVGEQDQTDPVLDDNIEYASLYLDFRDIEWYDSNDAVLKGYVWYAEGGDNAQYPGATLTFTTDQSAQHYAGYVQYNSAKTPAGVIFTRLGPDGTEWNKLEISDFTFDAAYPAYRLETANGNQCTGHWETAAEALSSTGTITSDPTPDRQYVMVYYYNAAGWSKVCLHYWNDSGLHNEAWPGAAMTAVEGHEGWYRAQLDKEATNVIFNDGTEAGAKTDELTIDLTKLYYKEGWNATYPVAEPDPTPTEVTVYYYNQYNWANVKAYVWINDVAHAVDWPGAAMTAVEGHDGWYSLTVGASYKYIIFNDGTDSGSKTTDLTIAQGKPYYYQGTWLADYPEQVQPDAGWDGVLTFDITAVDWFENDGCVAYIYVWYVDGTNNGWPTAATAAATRATRTAAGVYTYRIDTTKILSGAIVVRGNAAGTEFHNKTGDITEFPDSHIINIAWLKGINE